MISIWANTDPLPGTELIPCSNDIGFYQTCKSNAEQYAKAFGGSVVRGAIINSHVRLSILGLTDHYVVFRNGVYIDVTPYQDDRDYIIFLPNIQISHYNTYIRSLDNINKQMKQENELMYYVYAYLDPDTNKPMYIGKGSQQRAFIHKTLCKLKRNKQTTRFYNKLEQLFCEGKDSKVIFLAQNIIDEAIAYDIERDAIKQFGRVGYDEAGILLNICEDSSPPNHKGKSYKEIYGDQWEIQIERRREAQLKRGGYGPKQHTVEFKKRHSERFSGAGNPRYGAVVSEETKLKISLANTGKSTGRGMMYDIIGPAQTFRVQGSLQLSQKCLELGLSLSTLISRMNSGTTPSRGKTKGWMLIQHK